MKDKIVFLLLGVFIILTLILFLNATGITQGKYQVGLLQGGLFIVDTDSGLMKGYDFPTKSIFKFDYNTENIEMTKTEIK